MQCLAKSVEQHLDCHCAKSNEPINALAVLRLPLDLLSKGVKNPWVELTLENRLGRGECPRAYKTWLSLHLIHVGL